MSWLVELDKTKYDSGGNVFANFSAMADDYLHANAKALGWFAQLSYEGDLGKIGEILDLYRLRLVQKISRSSPTILPVSETRCLIASREDATIIGFGGTDPVSFANWITDFSFRPVHDVHGGFRAAADAVWDDIHAAAVDAHKAGRPVILTGHSLGGALAVLAASRLHDNDLSPQAVYTYGMPRVGQPIFAQGYSAALGARTFRLRHGGDIVPLAPLPQLGFYAFQHVGRFLQIDRFTIFRGKTPSADLRSNDPLASDAMLRLFRESIANLMSGDFLEDQAAANNNLIFPRLPLGVSDHLPDRYLHALTCT